MKSKSHTLHIGSPLPYGATLTPQDGTNFSIYARHDTMTLIIVSPSGSREEHQLSANPHRTGHVWHAEIRPQVSGYRYLWRVPQKDDRWLTDECLDPWATVLDTPIGSSNFNDRTIPEYSPLAVVPSKTSHLFDWQDVPRPKVQWKDLVVYELHVRGFTNRIQELESSTEKGVPGSYLGVVQRIPYLKALGVNAVELLPVMEFNETEWSMKDPTSGNYLAQYWGYSTVSFFSPMNRFGKDGSTSEEVVKQFKYMVRELHRAGIEVIMDVVYNHTAEMGLDFVGRGFYGMKSLAPFSYYVLQDNGHKFINHTGCGNTVNCNNPVVQELISESLRFWAHEMGIDGFRFDLASILCRGTDGEPLSDPPLIQRIAKDPSMRDIKLIAEPWDCGGLYQVGSFPHHGSWAEWNGKFRDSIRRFVKGDPGTIGEFATRICGSQDLYGHGRRPYHSVNFVTAHDGFSLRDLVSYDHKHNDHNGENNNDGEQHNNSWNCGVEGHTKDEGINALRLRQMKNMLVALFIAAGTPMLTMGDEYGHTKHGNNNGWCQDSELTWMDWKACMKEKDGMLRFTQMLVNMRRSMSSLNRDSFLTEHDVQWHGNHGGQPAWDSGYNFLGLTRRGEQDLFVAFNCGGSSMDVTLPHVDGGSWGRLIDTNLESPKDFANDGEERELAVGSHYGMTPFSCIVLRQLSGNGTNRTLDKKLEDSFLSLDLNGLDEICTNGNSVTS